MKKAALAIEKLLYFAQENGLINKIDVIYSRNLLLDILQVNKPLTLDKNNYELPTTAAPILSELLDYAVENKLIGNSITERDLFDTRLMNAVMPRPYEIQQTFLSICEDLSIEDATNWFYEINKVSEYIRRDRIIKNINWVYEDERYGTLELTINMSKPEKDPEEIKKILTLPKSGYPNCVLCKENMGYAGRLNHAARQTLRLLPIMLNNEEWYMQYSPYVYFNEHCIVLKHEHSPMLVNGDTIVRLLDFVDAVPHYFIGSNAGLPIVGGSILNHDHYQGGRAKLPMAKASIKTHLTIKEFNAVKCGIVNWPMNCIRLTSEDKKQLAQAASHIMNAWESYSDEPLGVINSTDEKHNAITPYARIEDDGYQVDLVLRNNFTTDKLPLGVFHPHPDFHHIKKENIGLIEVMGLFILPGRLKTELNLIEDILTGKKAYNEDNIAKDAKLSKHSAWIANMVNKHQKAISQKDANQLLQNEIGIICFKILKNAGVYKDTEEGYEGLMRFLASCGISKQ